MNNKKLHLVSDVQDEEFEECPADAHECAYGPWWHELSLEERASMYPAESGP